MPFSIPEYFFRTRENGALVFKVDAENRNARLEMRQIATVNLRKAEMRAQGDYDLSDADRSAIEDWMAKRAKQLEARRLEDALKLAESLHALTQWAQSEARPDELEVITPDLLLSIHDLRSVLVRKLADRAKKSD